MGTKSVSTFVDLINIRAPLPSSDQISSITTKRKILFKVIRENRINPSSGMSPGIPVLTSSNPEIPGLESLDLESSLSEEIVNIK